ncbi:DUF47 domain-containing protein [Vampirovibrio sp.]|uniref:DUF47 domain-containing protein n=1 Tax=Vampirovibrio sp. TaxID=2717857 RepID=UPI003593BDF6
MFNLLPREDKFLKMLQDMEMAANRSSRLMKKLVEHRHDEAVVREASDEIYKYKREAKKTLETLTQEICRTLITPFDREDLQEFAVALYNIPKLITKITDRLLTHNMHPYNGDFNKFVDLIDRQAEAMAAVIRELSGKLNSRTVNAKAAILHELEDQGDMVLGQLIASSFHDIEDVRELILRKDIYEMLEDVTDQYRDAANVAMRIILKHT